MPTRQIARAPTARGPGDLPPLAEAKLLPPLVRNGIVERPRIGAGLDAGRDAALTLTSRRTPRDGRRMHAGAHHLPGGEPRDGRR